MSSNFHSTLVQRLSLQAANETLQPYIPTCISPDQNRPTDSYPTRICHCGRCSLEMAISRGLSLNLIANGTTFENVKPISATSLNFVQEYVLFLFHNSIPIACLSLTFSLPFVHLNVKNSRNEGAKLALYGAVVTEEPNISTEQIVEAIPKPPASQGPPPPPSHVTFLNTSGPPTYLTNGPTTTPLISP